LINTILEFLNTPTLKKHLLALVILLTVLNNIFAQNMRIIKGNIKDKRTAESLIGASVMIQGTGTGTATDFDGNFTLKTDKPLPLVLVINYMGYIKLDYTVTSIEKPLAIKLEQNVTELKEAEIRDSRITEKQKQNPITVETMDATAIKQTPAANFYEGLAHLKGADLTSASIGFKIINTRGFNSTSPVRSLQLIDGVDNQSPGLNFSLGNFLGASELDVQKVDLIVGASSAYYGPNAFNGVINMQTKSPFLYPGLSVSLKGGERALVETAVRWAQIFKDKKGEDRYAYKLNFFYMRANDWEARNYSPTIQSPTKLGAIGGYDAVNIYGDEYVSANFYVPTSNVPSVGRGYFLRNGYSEDQLVDYNSRNLKLNAAFHYKIKKDIEFIVASNFGTGTTVYQGDNRFSLKDILFFQNKLELRKEGKFFIRAYATNEDAGKSYDAYSTAILLQNASKSDQLWGVDYNSKMEGTLGSYMLDWYNRNINGKGLQLDTIPGAGGQRLNYIDNYWQTSMADSLRYFHSIARNAANQDPSSNNTGLARFEPGTPQFDSAFQSIISKTNREGGSRLFDKSSLYHVAGEYQFNFLGMEAKSGASYRLYAPYSQGTIFLDTGNNRIYNSEIGAYLGLEKKIFNDKLKVSWTNRLDKNQNFNTLWSSAGTGVYSYKKHIIRGSFSSAIRNPTLTDQYINLNVGRATLLGNLNGFDSLVTISSLLNAFSKGRTQLEYFNVDPIKPEQVKTLEFGWRTSLFKDKLYLDVNYYFSWYTNFIGYKIGARPNWPEGSNVPTRNPEVFRVATNSKDIVTTQGFTGGINYFYKKYLGFAANYSWNVLDRQGSTDPLIPAFNTPEHKYNIGINGRDFDINFFGKPSRFWGYGINYKYQTGFMFEGSPQFTGEVPAYYMFDAQISKRIPAWFCTFKLGSNNLTDNRVYQVYGGPLVGRLAYFSLLFELDQRR
jgi:hypothetical protein